MRGWRVMLLLAVAGCGDPAPRTVRLDLVPRGSCGTSSMTYDITCVAALEVRLVKRGEVVAEACTAVNGRFVWLNDLITAAPFSVLDKTPPQKDVTVEVRGYHAFDKAACSDPRESELMLWGASGSIDLEDAGLQIITVPLECRPRCHCADFDEDPLACPRALPAGVCARPPDLACQRPCALDPSCYDGALSCIDEMCTPRDAGVCASCETDADCDDSVCVTNTRRGEQVCLPVCPAPGESQPCPTLMSCKRLGDDFQLVK